VDAETESGFMSGSYYLTCRLGQEWYGISIDHVLEVLHLVALNDSPTASSLGVMTLRDKVMPVIDLRQYFRLPEPDYLLETPIIAISQDDRQLGFVVDEANDVVLIQTETIEPYDEAVIQGVVRHNSRILFLLDIPGLFNEVQSSHTAESNTIASSG
jgi:purine-binding chemotaxis protein CheW